MRGSDSYTEGLFTMRRLDDFVPANHPLRRIRIMVNEALAKMDELFSRMYEADVKGGRPSVPPEKLLRAMLLQILFSIRSERQLMEQTQYNMLYRWFIGLSMDDEVWVPTVFTKNRQRLIEHDAIVAFFNEVINTAEKKRWLSGEHFSVDGTLIQAWAGHKSFVPKDGDDDDAGGTGDFKGKKRSNETHESKTDPDSRLFRKGKTASELRYMGHTLTDNRHGLVVNAMVTHADGYAEREAAKAMIKDARQAVTDPKTEVTLGADKGYDAAEFIEELQRLKVTPHVAQNKSGRRSAVPDEIAATEGYALSQRKRKLIEQGFGWAKFVGPIRQVMVRGDQEGRPAVRADDGGLQPHSDAHVGRTASAGGVMTGRNVENVSENARMAGTASRPSWGAKIASRACGRSLKGAVLQQPVRRLCRGGR